MTDRDGGMLPRFNLAAFLMPPVWGPAHGAWEGVIFLPMWLFADSAVVAGVQRGGGSAVAAALIAGGTLLAQAWFARHANTIAYRRVAHATSVAAFLGRQRIWAVALAPATLAMWAWAVYYDVVVRAAH